MHCWSAMNYELQLHPDVTRRLQSLTREPRESVTAALGELARDGSADASTDSDLVATWVRGASGERFRVQVAFDHDARAMHVLSLHPASRT